MSQDRLINRAKRSAYGILSWRQRTQRELYIKLKDKGFTENVIEQVINDLCDYGMINDESLAHSLVKKRLNNNKWGKRKIKQELAYRGVPAEISQIVLNAVTEEMESEIALQLIREKNSCTDDITFNKLAAYLNRRGFSPQVICRVVKYVREVD